MHMRVITIVGILALTAASASAQPAKRDRFFVSLGGGVQAAPPALSDSFSYDVNAEPADVTVDYPSKSSGLFDGGVGIRLFKSGGLAVSFTRASARGAAHVEADIPHPFLDNQDRHVSGDTGELTRNETAIHAQLYILKDVGRLRVRLSGGGTYFQVQRDVVTAVNVDESFPFDTATFRDATSERSEGSGPGFNVGADLTYMFTRRVGLGALMRYARGSIELNATEGRNVSVDAGGLQLSGGLRFSF